MTFQKIPQMSEWEGKSMPMKLFEENARVGSLDLLRMQGILFLKRPLLELSMLSTNTAARYYSQLGDDVFESKNEDFQYPNKPLWFNLGYWKKARTYPDACADLARYLGKSVEFKPTDAILDVGFGFADQDMLWHQEFHIKKIVGINITPLQVEVAQQRVSQARLSNSIELHLGSATELRFPHNSFDKVVALESAYHFRTREQFFAEAFQVLRPGGKMVLSDILPITKAKRWNLFQWLNRRRVNLPDVNMYDRSTYEKKLQAQGFIEVHTESIGNYIFPGIIQYIYQREQGKDIFSVIPKFKPNDFIGKKWVALWRDFLGIEDYIIAYATKPT